MEGKSGGNSEGWRKDGKRRRIERAGETDGKKERRVERKRGRKYRQGKGREGG
ncbi:MAG: hypothetical protein ABW098_20005 [Candidatus Thiodiazotropha sp.]